MTAPRTVDVHAHALMRGAEQLVQGEPGWAAELALQARWNGAESTRRNVDLFVNAYLPMLTDVSKRLAAMDGMNVDVQAVSVSPTQYHYWAEPDLAERFVRRANEELAELCASRPERLVGLGTVSLQHPGLAAGQLEFASAELGLRGVQISTRVGDAELDDPRFEPFWAKAEEVGALVFIHPLGCTLGERLATHYLSNVIGQPTETTIALARLIFGGVLDRHPRLRVCAAHGGGYLPHYIGRFEHAYRVRPESRTMKRRPREYLERIWFDSLVYEPSVLHNLVAEVGAAQVVLGTDYPFDMGVDDPMARLRSVAGLSSDDIDRISGGNAARLLRLDPH